MLQTFPASRPRLTPLQRPKAAAPPPDPAARIAARLARVAPAEPVRTLEALAVAEANRLRRRPPGAPAPPSEGEPGSMAPTRAALYRRIARRALAGSLDTPAAGASAYHRAGASPAWAAARAPVAEIGGFLFYA